MKLSSDVTAKALDALMAQNGNAALSVLKQWIAEAAGGSNAESEEESYDPKNPADQSDDDGSEGDGAEGVAPPRKAKAIEPRVVESRLTPAQLALCKAKGISAADFLAVKRTFQGPIKARAESTRASGAGRFAGYTDDDLAQLSRIYSEARQGR